MLAHWLCQPATEAASEIARFVHTTAGRVVHGTTVQAVCLLQSAIITIKTIVENRARAFAGVRVDGTAFATVTVGPRTHITLGTSPAILARARTVTLK
jgi:hypothetical protein